jgi:predicted ATP-dependent serine protease
MPEEAPKYICQECGRIQDRPGPCESCAAEDVVLIAGPSRAKALMPPARPL